ncbi:WYL domain-containing protein [Clostridium sp. D2Q-14]|uniref:helix-turn-helix transcriptional regulator n=1 Tax=Anaeromonas gelatinilytica TaxID=2683194 RepID=UPI00193AF6D8|nr:WYL domain-containing protein [Anaeromonas gelatinilytica]MBS4535009.1 WYL domain-containing protein [Anaeromonas gelatinilytica]
MPSFKTKLKIIYLMDILLEKTDENNPLTVKNLIEELSRYGITAERKSIYSDINLLRIYGLDIICEKGRSNKYFVASRNFELPELKLLVDSVQSSKFITHKKSKELIKKIESLTSVHQAKALDRYVIVADRLKADNERIFYNVDTLHRAIQENKQVRFKYFDYNLDKKIEFRRNGEMYISSPYALTWSDNNYYLIAYYDRYNDISNFRVDKMMDIELLDEDRYLIEGYENFNVAEYSTKIFNMYIGDLERVELEFHNSLINVAIDRFGKDIIIKKKDENYFSIKVEVEVSDTFLGWIFMFGDRIKIVSPTKLKYKMKEMAEKILKLY